MRSTLLTIALAVAASSVLGASARGASAPFTPGDVLVYREATNNTLIPTGATAATTGLASTGNEVFLDEYTPAGAYVGSVDTGMVDAGNSSSHGLMTISPNGGYLAVPGYARADAGGVNATTANNDARVVQVYRTSTGALNSTVSFTDSTITSDYRSAVTDGTSVWISGASTTGIRANSLTSPTATTSNIIDTTSNNFRALNIFGGQLYLSTNNAGKLAVVGTSASSTASAATGQTLTSVPGFPTSGMSPFQFLLFDLNGNDGILDTAYIADDGSTTSGIRKFSLVNGTWVENGDFLSSPTGAIRGLTGFASADGKSVTLYATNGNTSNSATSAIFTYTDSTGFSGTTTGLTGTLGAFDSIAASADADPSVRTGAFRGLVVLPGLAAVPEPASLGILLVGGLLALRRRR